MEEAKAMLEAARQVLSGTGSTPSLSELTRRIEALEDQTLALVQLNQRVVGQKVVPVPFRVMPCMLIAW
jgi:hypothetical protein